MTELKLSAKQQFEHMFPKEGGKFFLVCGPRGSGKTTLGASIMQHALKDHDGYVVSSNIILKQSTGTCAQHGATPKPRCKGCWKYPRVRGFHQITSILDVMRLLPDAIDADKTTLIVTDEAALSVGMQAGTSVISQDVRSVLALVTLLRKIRANWVLIVLDEQATMSKYREPGPILTGIFRRGVRVPPYDPKEVALLQGPTGSLYVPVTAVGFAKPQEFAEPGDVIFDTTSAASLSMGTHKDSPFDLLSCLMAISNCGDWEVSDRLRYYLRTGQQPPETMIDSPKADDLVDESNAPAQKEASDMPAMLKSNAVRQGDVPEPTSTKARSSKKGTAPEVDMRLRRGDTVSSIVVALGVSEQGVYKRQEYMRKESEIIAALGRGIPQKEVAKMLRVPQKFIRDLIERRRKETA